MKEEKQEGILYEVEEEVIASPAVIISRKSFLEKIIVAMLIGLVFLMPIFFLPISGVFLGFAKNLLLSGIVIGSLFLTFFLWIKQGSIVFSKSKIFPALFFLVFVYIFSSFLSGIFSESFFGNGMEITTSFEMFLLGALVFLFAVFFRTKERIILAFSALFASSALVFLFQIFHFVFPALTIVGISADKTTNLIGIWSDLGIFSGIIILLSLISLEKLNKKQALLRRVLYVFLVVALFFHALALYSISWIMLGIITLALSVFFFFERVSGVESENISVVEKWVLTPSFAVAMLSLFLVFAGPTVNSKLFQVLNIPPVQDIRPSWSGTQQVFLGVFNENGSTLFSANKKDIIFGVGPNRFSIFWQKYRPREINYTPWWSINFNEGVGTIPTSLITVGIIGALAWIVFLLRFIFSGVWVLRSRYAKMEQFSQFAVLASFVGASYCWIIAFIGTVGSVPFVFAFIFTGLFLGFLSFDGSSQVREYSYLKNPQKGFTVVVVLLCLLGSSVALGYYSLKETRSFFAYRNAVILATGGNLEKADGELSKALALAPSDNYFRSYSALNSYRAQQLVNRTDISPDDLRLQFGMYFKTSIESAQKAIAMDDMNYQNWVSLGNAYAMIVPFGIDKISNDAYVQAVSSYEKAALRDPFNPQIPYVLATLALSHNRSDDAKMYARRVLELKNDNPDALILLSRIEEKSGRLKSALSVMESAPTTELSNPQVLFRIGYLRYKTGNYQSAISALEKVVQMIPDYSDAKYFLGLSYYENSDTSKALKEFNEIKNLNPERTDIIQIINNIRNGSDPLNNQPKKETADSPEKTPAIEI
jgi:tetratricopeptide (TPR) repeat protein